MNFILKSKLFYVGLILRLLIIPFFGSEVLTTLFIPFLDDAVTHFGTNPWSLHPPHFFPYSSSIFLLLYVPRLVAFKIFGSTVLGAGFWGLTLIKLPLLMMDILLLYIITRLSPNYKDKAILYYWLNPILFYITYVHGQLDIVAIVFVFITILFLTRKKILLSSIAMALAILAKAHVAIVLPFLAAYIWNSYFVKEAIEKISLFFVSCVLFTFLGFIPLIKTNNFFYIGAGDSPQAQRIFATQLNLGGNQVLYLGLAIVFTVLGRLCLSTRFSDRGIIYGTGILLGSLILITNPMPGWYFWVFPFVIIFYVNFSSLPKTLFIFINFFFFCHFVLLPYLLPHDFPFWSGITLTFLQTSLAWCLALMWVNIISNELPFRRRTRPLLIGVAGDSGAGKNSLSNTLLDALGGCNAVTIEGDDYHKWERGHEKWTTFTHLHPQANHLSTLRSHMRELLVGKKIFHPHYDHTSGKFTRPRGIHSAKTILVQGLHTFYLKNMRSTLDIKIFLAPHKQVHLAWKIKRDVLERGYTVEKVLESLNKRENDSEKHIAPQRLFADWIIEYMPNEALSQDEILQGHPLSCYVKHTLWNDAPIEKLAHFLSCLDGVDVQVKSNEEDINRISLIVKGVPDKEKIEEIGRICFPHPRNVTRSKAPPMWASGFDGITQLIALTLIEERV